MYRRGTKGVPCTTVAGRMDQDGLFLMLKMCNGCSHNKVRVSHVLSL